MATNSGVGESELTGVGPGVGAVGVLEGDKLGSTLGVPVGKRVGESDLVGETEGP